MYELTFYPETHTYCVDGVPVPSVTQLTDIYSTVTVEDGDDLELTMEAAAERGTVMHSYIEQRLRGVYPEDIEIPGCWMDYADAVNLFLAEHTLEPWLFERPLAGEVEGVAFAGTPDYVGLFDGVPAILDWKFVSQVQKTKVGAQLSGYMSLCLCNDVFPEELYCVQFLRDGTYRLYPAGNTADNFDLCLAVWKEKTKKHPRGRIL